jgi:hypothetical protein
MMLAITGQWVAEVTTVLCLFGAACIGVAMTAGEGTVSAARRAVEQKASEGKPMPPPDEPESFA